MTLNEFKTVFFPKTFSDRYQYLGYVYWSDYESEIGEIIHDFIIRVDKIVKPFWCPRWVLRLTHLIGNDNSIVRVRNWKIHRLHKWLTKGIMITDIKTKWSDTDLRISGYFTQEVWNLIDQIENKLSSTERS